MATIKKLSTGFTGGSTREFSGFCREVETRMMKLKQEPFKKEFSPPGVKESFPGANFDKRSAPYQDRHTDFAGPSQLAATSQDIKDQESLDVIDEIEQKIQAPIKNPYDQFPGEYHDKDIVNSVGYDYHQTDPARLNSFEEFNKEVNRRMRGILKFCK